jgi:hypothetical protein
MLLGADAGGDRDSAHTRDLLRVGVDVRRWF